MEREMYRDRDYLQDEQGDIYQVIGSLHPEGGIYALKKYQNVSKNPLPWRDGSDIEPEDPISRYKPHDFRLWKQKTSGDEFFRILPNYSSLSANSNIKINPYRRFSSVFGRDMIIVPRDMIQHHFLPVSRLQELISAIKSGEFAQKNALDSLERKAADISLSISSRFSIPVSQVGITGSILWYAQHEFSDVDLMVYGYSNAIRIVKGYGQLASEGRGLRRLLKLEMFPLAEKMAIKTGLPTDECFEYVFHKQYLLMFNDLKISVTFAPSISDLLHYPFIYAESKFTSLVPITIKARITSEKWGVFYPGLYQIDVEEILHYQGPHEEKPVDIRLIHRLVVYEHDIAGYYHKGDAVEIRGLLQECRQVPEFHSMTPTDGYQILVGAKETFGNEYVRLIKS